MIIIFFIIIKSGINLTTVWQDIWKEDWRNLTGKNVPFSHSQFITKKFFFVFLFHFGGSFFSVETKKNWKHFQRLVRVSLWCEKVDENFPVHVVEGRDVHAQGLGHARHVKPERLKKCQEVNVLTWNRKRKRFKIRH